MTTKNLIFKKIKSGNNKTYDVVIEDNNGDYLGIITWDSALQQYMFRPDQETKWDFSCLKDVTDHIDELINQ